MSNLVAELSASLAEIKQMLEWFVINAPDEYQIDFLRAIEFGERMKRADAALNKARESEAGHV